MKKKILITGSNGFVGKSIKEELKNKHHVYGLGRKKNKEKNYFNINLNEKKKLNQLFKKIKFDIIIHCAWYTNHEDYRQSKKNNEYLKMSKFLLDSFIMNGGKEFISLGTCEEYKKKKFGKNFFSERSEIKPINNYAKCKNIFHNYLKSKKIKYKWLRIFYLFGEGENKKRLFPLIINHIYKNKKIKINYPYFKTDFIYVKKLAKIINKIIDKKVSGVFNLCSGESINIINIYDIIKNLLKKPSKLEIIGKKKLNYENIYGCTKKLKKNKCFIKTNFENDIKKYLLSFKHVSPRLR
jgi:nucleoside-diphosphate-sugar epimerase